MAKKYQKDIKVVLPKSDPFRDIAVYGAGEEMIKALGGELPDKGKQPDIIPTSNNPYFKKRIKKFGKGGPKDKDIPKNITSGDVIKPIVKEAYRGVKTGLNWVNDRLGDTYEGFRNYMAESPTVGPEYFKWEATKLKPWLFENIRPVEYPNPITAPKNIIMGALGLTAPPAKDNQGKYDIGEEAWKKSLGLPTEQNYIVPSKYKPSNAKDPNTIYHTMPKVIDPNKFIQEAKKRNLKKGDKVVIDGLKDYIQEGFMDPEEFKNIDPLQNFTMGVGEDKKGKYVSIYDIYDFKGPLGKITNPYEFYDRYYYKANGGPLNNTDTMKKSNKKGQSPRTILSPEQKMAMEFGWGGALGTVLGTGAALGLTALTGGAAAPLIPAIAGAGASIGGSIGSNIEEGIDKNKQRNLPQQQYQYQQNMPQMQFAKGGMLNKRSIPHKGTSEQMPYQHQMQSYPNLEFGNGEQMLAMGGELEDIEMYKEGGIYIKPSKRGTFTAAAKKRGMGVQEFASKVLANKESYSSAMVKKANFARNAAKWKHADGGMLNPPLSKQELKWLATGLRGSESADYLSGTYIDNTIRGGNPARIKRLNDLQKNQLQKYMQNTGLIEDIIEGITPNTEYFNPKPSKSKLANGGFLQEPEEGVIERRNKNRSREPQEYATFEENFKHMYADGGLIKRADGSYSKRGLWDNIRANVGSGKKPTKEMLKQEAKIKREEKAMGGAMGPMDVSNIYYADGGMLNEYNGYRHEDGGIPIGPNAEVEGGETSMKMAMGGEQDATYIFSDRLKVPGKNYTFAEASKKIDNKYNKRTNDKLSNESKRLELNKLMDTQEQERAGLVNSAYQTIAAYGGPIRKYNNGGPRKPGDNWNNPPIDNSAAEAGRLAEEMWAIGRNPRRMPTTNLEDSGYKIPDKLSNISAPDFNEQPAKTFDFGTGEQWATGIGYGLQGASLLARQLQLSRNKLSPNKAFTMERQVLNAKPQLDEVDVSAAIANRNIQTLGASTSSGGAMAGYLAAQAGRTRSKADILSDLQNRQAQVDMNVDQYNAMANERAYDKNAADLAAQQTSQAQLFADYGNLGAGITRDYLLRQAQEGLMGSIYNPYFRYNKQKGRNRYNTEYTGNI